MDSAVEELVQNVHASPIRLVLFATGGGVQAVAWLLSVPGASKTVLEVKVPYSTASLAATLGSIPISSANASTAEALASAALQQAANVANFRYPLLGVGAACALATDRERKGEDRIYVAVDDGMGLGPLTSSIVLTKGSRTRQEQDEIASRLIISVICQAAGMRCNLELGLFAGDVITQPDRFLERPTPEQAVLSVLEGRARCVEFSAGRILIDVPRSDRVILSGSFNPMHDGHVNLLKVAVVQTGCDCEGVYELSIGNADKGVLPIGEVMKRVKQFVDADLPLILTSAPLFTQKAQLFPRSTFVVGYDTALRLVNQEYYGTEANMAADFSAFAGNGCKFLVAGRKDASTGKFSTLEDLRIPQILDRWSLFKSIPEVAFRKDISSTEIRSRTGSLKSTPL